MGLTMVETALFLQGRRTTLDGLRAVKRAIEGIGDYMGAPFVPYLDKHERLLRTEDVSALRTDGFRIVFNHEPLARAFKQTSWLLSVNYLDVAPEVKEIRIYPYHSTYDSELTRVWEVTLDLMPRLVEATQPSLAAATGRPEEDEVTDYLPAATELLPGRLPPFLTAWNYIGSDRLNEERRRFLHELPVIRSQALGEGWLLQVVSDLCQRPHPDFIAELNAMNNPEPLGYRQPEIDC